MEKLYSYYCDCGRSGHIEGLFIADENFVKNSIGSSLYFGEILGKHSEITGILEEKEITEIEVSSSTLNELKIVLGDNISGYNPLNYIEL